ncbi:MAG: methylation-associated defense system ATP-binding protein MAD8, partial [Dysgonomonas sp.]
MELNNIYYQRFLSLIIEEYKSEFSDAKQGHCMKITGLTEQQLYKLQQIMRETYPAIRTYILSDTMTNDHFITSTKLIELRNDLAAPLLVLIPSNSKTSVEDSFGNTTFKDLNIANLDLKLLTKLRREIPQIYKTALSEIFDYLKVLNINCIQYIYFLLEIGENSYTEESIGKAISHLTLIPDTKLIKEYAQIRQRLMFNLKCIELLGDFGRTMSDRILDLPVSSKTIQEEIAYFFKTEKYIKNKKEICERIASDYPNLDFSNWPIPEIENKQDIQLFVDSMSSPKNFKVKEGDYTLVITPGKPAKITLTISTQPSPKDYRDLKYFRVVLMAIDGWHQVVDVRRAKVTENIQKNRKITVELSDNILEEGSYFFRVFAEDENGVLLNTQDAFRNRTVEDRFLEQEELSREEFQSLHQVKYTSDSEDFFISIGDESEVEGEGVQRKDKLDNVLQAFFKFRIEQLRSGQNLAPPELIDESGVWIKDPMNNLQATFHVKYTLSHNYQINIPKKLFDLESVILNHSTSLGRVEAQLSNNPTDLSFQSLKFIPFDNKYPVPPKLISIRQQLFSLIRESAPDSKGIFETFDFFNHKDSLKEYLEEIEKWTNDIKTQISSNQKDGIRDYLVELQNIDIISLQTKLPDGEDISVKLISPLHPLRLSWFLNLYNLYTEWEEKTIVNEEYKKAWYKNLDRFFTGSIVPEQGMLVLQDMFNSEYSQYIGELMFGWGMYSVASLNDDDFFTSVSRQIKMYISTILNISNEYRIDRDVNRELIEKHLRNYLLQHPYTRNLVINLFNIGDAYALTNALVELEKYNEFKNLRYELRLFHGNDLLAPGEALKNLLNPESNIISEEAESFSQPSKNRLFPKLRFSINNISDFIDNTKEYTAHISFVVNPFPVKTTLIRPSANKQSFYFNNLISKPVVAVNQRGETISWSKYLVTRKNDKHSQEDYTTGIFDNLQSIVANSLATGESQS